MRNEKGERRNVLGVMFRRVFLLSPFLVNTMVGVGAVNDER